MKGNDKKMKEDYIPYRIEDSIAVVRMSRPPVNGLDFEFLRQLGKVSDELGVIDDIRVVVITSAFKVFGAGLDLKMAAKMDKDKWHNYALSLHNSFNKLENIPKPTIAVINGAALAGGLLISLSCDFRFIGEKEGYFSLPEVNLGIPYLAGSTIRLQKMIGRVKSTELMFTGRDISAREALEIGLVNKVFKDEELFERSMEFARILTSKGRHSIAAAKRCMNESLFREIQANLPLEHEAVNMTVETDEIKEGFASFFEKREPNFRKIER